MPKNKKNKPHYLDYQVAESGDLQAEVMLYLADEVSRAADALEAIHNRLEENGGVLEEGIAGALQGIGAAIDHK